MSGFLGADTEALRHHAVTMKERSRTIAELRERLEPLVMDEGAWRGPDAEAFRSRWTAGPAARFQQISEQLDQRSTDLDHQAEEQDQASDGEFAGAGSGGPGGGGESPLDILRRALGGAASGLSDLIKKGLDATGVYNKLQGAYKGAKKIWDVLKNMKDPEELAKKTLGLGKGFSGLAGKLLGKLGIPTGFLNKDFFSKLDGLAERGPFLRFLGKGAARILPGLDVAFGAKQMYDSWKSGDLFHLATGSAQTAGGLLLTVGTICDATGVGAVVGVPLQVAGGILVGGAALADGAKYVYDHWDTISPKLSAAKDWALDRAGDLKDTVTDTASGIAHKAQDVASDTVHDVGEGLKSAGNGLKHAFGL